MSAPPPIPGPPSVPSAPTPPQPPQGSAAPKKGPSPPKIPNNVSRSNTRNVASGTSGDGHLSLDNSSDYEVNLFRLLNKDLIVSQHDREMSVALMQVHLDRAEVLDEMPLSMPVATVIGDNNGAILKSLELAMKAGERIHKAAELLVKAKVADDKILIDTLKQQIAIRKLEGEDADGWGDTDDLPGA